MEPVEGKMRLVAVLGKFQVIKVERGAFGCRFTLQLPSSVTITCEMPISCDVRLGDLLTLYTEVLADAQPSEPPEQRVH